MDRRSWYYITMLLFLAPWGAGYFLIQGTRASDLAFYVLAVFILYTTLCAYIVFRAREKPAAHLVNLSHRVASYGMTVGLVGWVPIMSYVKAFTHLHGHHPAGIYMISAFFFGAIVFVSAVALIYQYIMYGVTWLLLKAGFLSDDRKT